jgi:hypothetical protein
MLIAEFPLDGLSTKYAIRANASISGNSRCQ